MPSGAHEVYAEPEDRPGTDTAYGLAEIRKRQSGARQTDIAVTMGVSQARVSKLERGDLSRTELGTVQSYIAALGGCVRILAEFGEDRFEVRT